MPPAIGGKMGAPNDLRLNPCVAAHVRRILTRSRHSAARASAIAMSTLLSVSAWAGEQPPAAATPARADDQLQEVVVTGQRKALETAQHVKEVSLEVVDSVVA